MRTLTWSDRVLLALFLSLPLVIWFGAVFSRRHVWVNKPGVDGVDTEIRPSPFAIGIIGLVLHLIGFVLQSTSSPR